MNWRRSFEHTFLAMFAAMGGYGMFFWYHLSNFWSFSFSLFIACFTSALMMIILSFFYIIYLKNKLKGGPENAGRNKRRKASQKIFR